MKKILSSFVVFMSFYGYSQVGIRTEEPEATLDIRAEFETGTSSKVDGLLIPRVDSERALNMDGISISTLIYVNDIKPGTAIGKAVDINEPGYYYFNGNQWIKLFTENNIYTSDGTLAGNRIVSQGDKNLSFTSSATSGTSHFSIDGATLNIDAVNDRVGIGTSTPQNALHVNETLQLSGSFNVGGNSNTVGSSGLDGQILISKGEGLPPQWITSNSAFSEPIIGDFNSALEVSSNSSETSDGPSGGFVDSGIFIDLPKGKWILNIGLTFNYYGTARPSIWHAYIFSASSQDSDQTGFTHLGSAGSVSRIADLMINSSGTSDDSTMCFISGSNVIEVTAEAGVKLFVIIENRKPGVWTFRPNASGNYLYAIPIN